MAQTCRDSVVVFESGVTFWRRLGSSLFCTTFRLHEQGLGAFRALFTGLTCFASICATSGYSVSLKVYSLKQY